MLGGVVLLGEAAGTYGVSGHGGRPAGRVGRQTAAGVVLVLLGVATKSALVPFHPWLPAAMAAPTPVSAYLHAAAMVKAGVYLDGPAGPRPRRPPALAPARSWSWACPRCCWAGGGPCARPT